MPRLMLDTNICAYIIKRRPPALRRHFEMIDPSDVAVSCIVVAELWTGVMKSNRSAKNRTALENFLTDIVVLDWPKAAVRLYASVRAHLERLGSRIGEMDLLIAAHALHENLPLVTNNREEFRRVPGLKVESWLR
jgi:tRNA(fMet)-specific endonuclease VapC